MLLKKCITKEKPKKPQTKKKAGDSSSTIIYFCSKIKEYGELSNFYSCSFDLDSKNWKTVEHYFQAYKTLDPKDQEYIRNLPTPKEAKQYGRMVSLRKDWEEIKLEVMKKACLAKFTQNENLKKILLSTGTKELREHTFRDKFWGDGGKNGKGKNHLGKILMEIREKLK